MSAGGGVGVPSAEGCGFEHSVRALSCSSTHCFTCGLDAPKLRIMLSRPSAALRNLMPRHGLEAPGHVATPGTFPRSFVHSSTIADQASLLTPKSGVLSEQLSNT